MLGWEGSYGRLVIFCLYLPKNIAWEYWLRIRVFISGLLLGRIGRRVRGSYDGKSEYDKEIFGSHVLVLITHASNITDLKG